MNGDVAPEGMLQERKYTGWDTSAIPTGAGCLQGMRILLALVDRKA